jgi:hypothetical protein
MQDLGFCRIPEVTALVVRIRMPFQLGGGEQG